MTELQLDKCVAVIESKAPLLESPNTTDVNTVVLTVSDAFQLN